MYRLPKGYPPRSSIGALVTCLLGIYQKLLNVNIGKCQYQMSDKSNHKKPTIRRILSATFDRRLYGLSSFVLLSGPYLAIGFIVQVLIYLALNPAGLLIFVPLFALLILISAIASKNLGREVNSVGFNHGFLFFIATILASVTPFLIKTPSDPIQASLQFIVLYAVSATALIVAVVDITVCGQRVSLRESMQLTENFLKKQKQVWEKELGNFPNAEKIISNMDGCRAIPALFDKGSFGLAVLWICNVIEQTTDAIAEGVISKDSSKKKLFRKEDNSLVRYPKQLANIGFEPKLKNRRDEEQITTEFLWHEVRRKIAHYNYKPSFEETSGAIYILNNFIIQVPNLLKKLNLSHEVTQVPS